MMSVIVDKPVLNLNSVVYGTDFSPCSQNAGLYAARLSTFFSAKLLVAHAFTLSQAALEVEIGDQKASQQRSDLNRLLSKEAHLPWNRFVESRSYSPGGRSQIRYYTTS